MQTIGRTCETLRKTLERKLPVKASDFSDWVLTSPASTLITFPQMFHSVLSPENEITEDFGSVITPIGSQSRPKWYCGLSKIGWG